MAFVCRGPGFRLDAVRTDTSVVERWPDPTEAEARALIVGLTVFWGCWPIAAVGLVKESPLLLAMLGCLAGGIWFYWSGILHVMARASGRSVASLYFGGFRQAWRFKRDGTLRGSWRLFTPAYFRRAAHILGWKPARVIAGLGILLAADLVVFVWMMTSTASTAS